MMGTKSIQGEKLETGSQLGQLDVYIVCIWFSRLV